MSGVWVCAGERKESWSVTKEEQAHLLYCTVLCCMSRKGREKKTASVYVHVWGLPRKPVDILISWAGGEMKECEDYCLVIVSRVQQCCYISKNSHWAVVHIHHPPHIRVMGYVHAPKGAALWVKASPPDHRAIVRPRIQLYYYSLSFTDWSQRFIQRQTHSETAISLPANFFVNMLAHKQQKQDAQRSALDW